MKRLFLFAFILVSLLAVFRLVRHFRPLPKTLPESFELIRYEPGRVGLQEESYVRLAPKELCGSSGVCLVLWMAPWCPDCSKMIRRLNLSTEKFFDSRGIDVSIVIGKDSLKRCRDYQGNFSDIRWFKNIYLDPAGKLFRSLGIRYIPQWLALNRQGEILERSPAYPIKPNPSGEVVYLPSKILKSLDEYLASAE